MSNVLGPATAPSTAPTSPTTPTSTSGLIDPEKANGLENCEKSPSHKAGHYLIETTAVLGRLIVSRLYCAEWISIQGGELLAKTHFKERHASYSTPASTRRWKTNSFTTRHGLPLPNCASTDLVIVDDHPEGYPQVAAFVNSDDNFLIARKYGFLRSRLLLYRQDELSVLEKALVALDDEDKKKDELKLRSRKHDEVIDKDPLYSRKVLMGKIDDKLKKYGKPLARHSS